MTGEENVLRTPILSAFFAVLSLTACAGAPPKQQGDGNEFPQPTKTEPTETTGETGESTGEAPPEESGGLNEEQKKQMEIALRRGGDKAAQCPTSTGIEDVPRGKGEVKVVFDGQKGRVTEVTVGPPWAGGPIESCIKRSFIGEIVLPFDGDPLEVPYTIELPPVRVGTSPGKKK
ncbi:MAG: hypothetical protein HUU21_36140 [Polyangiaceae bacterium]|nr:hypothetical protein [Polyangiaceae bacterium]NUQ78985.1 hypothetical protein [Polyangiaceae bacterium]